MKRRIEEEMAQNMDMSQTSVTAVRTPPEQEDLVRLMKDMSVKMDKLTERVAKIEIETSGATSSDGGFVPVPMNPGKQEQRIPRRSSKGRRRLGWRRSCDNYLRQTMHVWYRSTEFA